MGKSTHFAGQPVYSQLLNLISKSRVLSISKNLGGEHYVKKFTAWEHLVFMIYSSLNRFDSLREIELAVLAEARKMHHLGVDAVPKRSTLSDANARRPEGIFGKICFSILKRYGPELLADSRNKGKYSWIGKLLVIDSTTILQRGVQGRRAQPHHREEERRNQGPYCHEGLRRRPVLGEVHVCSHA